MVDYPCHFSFFILDEGKLRAVKRSEEIGLRLGIMKTFITDGQGTKHALAEIMAERFPDELGSRLPPKRKPWMSEDSRMNIFDAAALALVFRLKKENDYNFQAK
jgi:hypothetical protein